ncbi:1423_t:CDS:2 [Dentiscutata erythropus]|uniref:1423_t:CDS:1 n=1 Tax=Dentiscutata erythropus TaxID=1348616 RepID=A0A9N8WPB6_9GLOM|nr:1423_t:CDS:2 [Dentiscutata erythropus]
MEQRKLSNIQKTITELFKRNNMLCKINPTVTTQNHLYSIIS